VAGETLATSISYDSEPSRPDAQPMRLAVMEIEGRELRISVERSA
jgi:hypothetical protein